MCQDGEKFRETQLHCLGIWLHALRYQVRMVNMGYVGDGTGSKGHDRFYTLSDAVSCSLE